MTCYIVAKTRVRNYYCIGALTETGKNIRLCENDNFRFMPEDNPYEVGEIWSLKFRPRRNRERPHLEDTVVLWQNHMGHTPNIALIIQNLSSICEGGFDCLYGGSLLGPVRSGNMYLEDNRPIPSMSVEFWRPDRNMTFEITQEVGGKLRRAYRIGNYSIPYVGVAEPVDVIPAGVLVRTSLTRWLPREDDSHPQRCWLQVSQVYT